MPIYEYQCPNCDEVFSHLWRSFEKAETGEVPVCPNCGAPDTRRLVSQVTVLGGLGGLTPTEQSEKAARDDRIASITPKDHIDKLRAGKKPKD